LKILIALFFIAHGLVHAGLAAAPDPKDPEDKVGAFFTSAKRSWLLPKLGLSPITIQWIGIGLVSLATLGFVLAGLGIFGVPGLDTVWQVIAIISAAISLLLLILFWHRWLVVGILIDLVILAELLWINWLPASVFYE
jgi:hypothetical protein